MGKIETKPATEKKVESKMFDIDNDILKGATITSEHAKKALEEIAKTNDEKRTAECKAILSESVFATKHQLLKVRMNSKKEEANKKKMKAICVLGPDGNPIAGLTFEVLQGKHTQQSFDTAKRAIQSEFNKEIDEIERNYRQKLDDLRRATPDYISRFSWGYDD